MTTYGMGTQDQHVDSVEESATLSADGDVLTAPGQTRIVGGFRMEGAPELEVVFGDTSRYRRHIDSFYELHQNMSDARTVFTQQVQAALLAVSNHRGKCDVETLAPLYYKAHLEGENYRKLGADFEREYAAIRGLHKLGETAGLTPDYRWKVNRVRRLYKTALVDYKEMRIAFFDQLATELQARGCSTEKLLAVGKDAPSPDLNALTTKNRQPSKPHVSRHWREKLDKPVVPASTVTFFVDNTDCTEPLDVYVDGTLLGNVGADSKTAFQALAGRHSLCLLNEKTNTECGQAGTVRTSYIHDGWSIRLHCK